MEEEYGETKIGFFKRLKMAIFNLENYKIFANEKFGQACKYMFGLIVIVTIVLAITTTISFRGELNKLIDYVETDVPDFALVDNTLEMEGTVEAYDEEYDAYLYIDVRSDLTDEEITTLKDEANEKGYYSFVFLNDSIYCVMDGYEYEPTYEDITSYLGIEDLTKDELFNDYLDSTGMMQITAVLFIYAIIYFIVSNLLTIIEDILIVGIFGWLASKLCRVDLTFAQNCSLATYSVTLSLLLSTIYIVVNRFTGFYIEYFSLLYMIIAYIYIVAAIMIIRANPNQLAPQDVGPIEEKPIAEIEGPIEDVNNNNSDNNNDNKNDNDNNNDVNDNDNDKNDNDNDNETKTVNGLNGEEGDKN